MIQCKDCEFYESTPDGHKKFTCDPFATIKEPECIQKMLLVRLDMMLSTYKGMMQWYEKMAPLQDKIFKYMQREIEDIDESDRWKLDDEPADFDDNDQNEDLT